MSLIATDRPDAPLVSVVLPVFNGADHIAEAIRSIQGQTFKNFELIVINDGSTDSTGTIIDQMMSTDARICAIHQSNRGLVSSLNAGIAAAHGVWIARMDHDDIALPNRLARQLEFLEETGADICGSWVQLFGTGCDSVLRHQVSDEAIKVELLFDTPFAHPSVVMRAEKLRLLGYVEAWQRCEDYDLWERAAKAGWLMANVPEVLLFYRQHSHQVSRKHAIEQHRLRREICLRYWRVWIAELQLSESGVLALLALRETPVGSVNMDRVDQVVMDMMARSSAAQRRVVFEHVTRLYFRAASGCRDIVWRWNRLNTAMGNRFDIKVSISLTLISLLRIQVDSKWFNVLKTMYLRFAKAK